MSASHKPLAPVLFDRLVFDFGNGSAFNFLFEEFMLLPRTTVAYNVLAEQKYQASVI